jgi:hypothetical protein
MAPPVETPERRAGQDLYLVKSILHAAEILSAFRDPGEALRLRDVTDRTGFSKGMCFRLLFTTIRDLLATPLSLSPGGTRYVNADFKPQRVYNWSVGIQRDLGWSLVADLAYVGSAGRQILQYRNLNATPYGTNFLASSIDPTTGGALPSAFLRPYRGFLDILAAEFNGISDYHSVQAQVNRRFTRGLQFGVAYTWAKAKNIGGALPPVEEPVVHPFFDARDRNYFGAGREHTVTINYSYDLPSLSRVWDQAVVRAVFDGWQLSGVTTGQTGRVLGVGYGIQGVSDLTVGTGVDSRVDFTCDPNLPRGDRTPTRAFRTECVSPPSAATNRVGTARGDELIGPGYLNFDISLAKSIPLGGKGRRLQLRGELYNALNSVQFLNVNTTAIFNAAGQQVNNEFGRYTSARDARRAQLMVRLQF